MATPVALKPVSISRESVSEVKHLFWSTDVNEELFSRWSQGFIFSETEPTALLQYDGGPCAVIAPVQAFLLKAALFSEPSLLTPVTDNAGALMNDVAPAKGTVDGCPASKHDEDNKELEADCSPSVIAQLKHCSKEDVKRLLCWALGDILTLSSPTDCTLVYYEEETVPNIDTSTQPAATRHSPLIQSAHSPGRDKTKTGSTDEAQVCVGSSAADAVTTGCKPIEGVGEEEGGVDPASPRLTGSAVSSPEVTPNDCLPESLVLDEEGGVNERGSASTCGSVGSSPPKKLKTYCNDHFHNSLRCVRCKQHEVIPAFFELIDRYTGKFGVLSFIYSVILTKTVSKIQEQVEDPSEPLIDRIHGHGSQSIINLLLTGVASGSLFDGEKDVGGLKIYGIASQSPVGLLTVLEHYRYVEVGWYLKNPQYPIWLLASETHLSLVFSEDRSLISADSEALTARRILKTFESDAGNGFILTAALPQALNALNITSAVHSELQSKLDADGYGIILINDIINEFYASDSQKDGDPNSCPREMALYHYNGIKQSNCNREVSYHAAEAKTTDIPSVLTQSTDSSTIVKCLQTKWPTLEVSWKGEIPNMN